MKTKFLKALTIGALFLGACASLTPQETAAITSVETIALGAGVGYLQGGQAGAIAGGTTALINQVQAGNLGLRSTEVTGSTTVPSTATIASAISTASGSPQLGAALAAKIAPAVAKSVASVTPKGSTPKATVVNSAIESAATGLDKAVAVVKANPQAATPASSSVAKVKAKVTSDVKSLFTKKAATPAVVAAPSVSAVLAAP